MRAIVPFAIGPYSYVRMGYANPHAVTEIGNTGGATTTYVYDNNGNVTSSTGRGFQWDYRNRLTAAGAAGATTTYAYDHANQRVLKKTSTATTTFVNMYFNIASTSSNATATKHIFTPSGELLATVVGTSSAATTTYLHLDHLGGMNVATDGNQEVVQTLDYYPYGSQRIATGSFSEQRRFTGHEYDSESDLTYANARYYEQKIGRWLSRDPQEGDITNPQSLNTYSYSLNNPVKYLDPNGEAAVLFTGLSNNPGDMYNIAYLIQKQAVSSHISPPFVEVRDWNDVGGAKAFLMGRREENPNEPIVIAGHSLGGWAAYFLASELGAQGIEVDSLIQVESVAPNFDDKGVLENVKRHFNFSTLGLYPGIHGADSVWGAGKNNYNLPGFFHTNIDKTALVQQTIAHEVIKAHREASQKALYDFVMSPLTPFGALANFWQQREAMSVTAQSTQSTPAGR
jgi:RHS repeat-associated protein